MKKDVKRLLTSELLVVFLLSSLGGEVVSDFCWVVLVLVGWFWGWAIVKGGWREMTRIWRRWSDFKMGEHHLIDFLSRSGEGVPCPEMKRELIAKASLNWSLGLESSCISISTSLLSRVAPREDSGQGIMDSRGRDFAPQAGHGGSTAAGKILLVEDIEINRILLRKLFQDLNFLLEEAENGQVAVDYFKQGKSYDLVLMDKEMPVMDGHEATRQLRSLGVKTPIIALTGNSLQSDKDMFFQAGADEFRSKPLSRAELVRLLARYVGLQSTRQQ